MGSEIELLELIIAEKNKQVAILQDIISKHEKNHNISTIDLHGLIGKYVGSVDTHTKNNITKLIRNEFI